MTVPDKYPIPNIQDFTSNVAGSHVFSTLNLVKGYYQVEMFPDDIPKSKDRNHHAFQPVQFRSNAFWLAECGFTFPAFDGPHPRWIAFHLCLS